MRGSKGSAFLSAYSLRIDRVNFTTERSDVKWPTGHTSVSSPDSEPASLLHSRHVSGNSRRNRLTVNSGWASFQYRAASFISSLALTVHDMSSSKSASLSEDR